MICSHCGADNKDDATKCAQCGEPLKPSADKNTTKKSNASSRIRKISVDSVESRGASGKKKGDKGDERTGPLPGLRRRNKESAVEDTLDLSGFHLEDVELQEIDLDEGDFSDMSADDPGEGSRGFSGPFGKGFGPSEKNNRRLWIFGGIVALLLIIAAVVLLYMRHDSSPDYADTILEGNQYYREEDYTRAQEAYNRAIQMEPGQAEAYFCMADVYVAMEDIQSAVNVLQQGYDRTQDEQLLIRLNELPGQLESKGESSDTQVQTDVPESSAAETVPETDTQAAETADAGSVIVWAVNPSVEADTIMPVLGCTPEEDIYSSPVSVIYRDGQAGLIDQSGNIVAEPQYRYILRCAQQLYAGLSDGRCLLLNEDYTLNEETAHSHSAVSYTYLWDSSQNLAFRVVHTADGDTVEETPYEIGENVLLPVIAGSRESYSLENPVYALAGSEGLKTDFIYENTGGCSWNGMMAVCRDGRWGYCNLDGTEVIPCQYDGADYVNTSDTEALSFTQGAPYGYSESFVAVRKDGRWGYFDKSGQAASPFVFEEARPVSGGYAWVKYEGQWGVITLTNE